MSPDRYERAHERLSHQLDRLRQAVAQWNPHSRQMQPWIEQYGLLGEHLEAFLEASHERADRDREFAALRLEHGADRVESHLIHAGVVPGEDHGAPAPAVQEMRFPKSSLVDPDQVS